jgi:UDP-glucose 4-epimerase
MVVPRFVRAALADRDLHVYGDGEQTRCFCHVKDVVTALADLMLSEQHLGEVFNIGSTDETSIRVLAERVIDLTSSSASIVTVPYSEAFEGGFEDMMRRRPDISKIEAALGWEPRRSLDDILRDVVAYEETKVLA